MSNRYNLQNIRALLTEGFTPEELRRLCHDTPEFRAVYDNLAENMSQAEIIDRLLEHAGRKLQLEQLLAIVKAQSPARYQAHRPYYDQAELEGEVAQIERAIAAQEISRGLLPDEQIDAVLKGLQARLAAIQALLSELTQPDDQPRFEATLSGSGAIAQGDRAKAAGERGVVADNVSGDIITGDQNRKITAETYIEKQEFMQPDPAARRLSQLQVRYLKRLAQRCNVLPLATLGGGDEDSGDEVRLDDVYVALDTQTRIPLTKAEKAKLKSYERAEDRPLTALEAATQTRRFVLLGDPGSGKSTFVRRLAVWLARVHLGEQRAPEGWQAATWPILTVLRDLAPRLAELTLAGISAEERDRRLVGAVWAQWRADLAEQGAADLADELEDILTGGQILLIFDGLDEVPERVRQRVRQAVQAILNTYAAVERILVTCRIRSYAGSAALPGFTAHTLAPFNAQQIRHFITTWYQTQVNLGHLDQATAKKHSDDLEEVALVKDLRELSANPMLLTTMALIHQREVGLPKERVRLYALAVQVLLSRWQKRKGVTISAGLGQILADETKLRAILERLAYEAHQQQATQGPEVDLSRRDILALLEAAAYLGDIGLADEFLDYVDQRAGLLIGRGGDEIGKKPQLYNFPHRTFQEYLAGCTMVTGRGVAREYWRRVKEGDYWYLAGQLGAEELLYNRRNLENLLDLAYALCPVSPPQRQAEWRAVLWSGHMAVVAGREAIECDSGNIEGGTAYLHRLIPRLEQIVSGQVLRAMERAEAGRVLGNLGDPRKAVTTLEQMEFCFIPAGPFWMGSPDEDKQARDDEKPLHQVEVPYDYWIGRYPVTVAQFRAFVEASGHQPEDETSLRGLDNHPVMYITWDDALNFCKWLTQMWQAKGRIPPEWQVILPSEAEWEKAARGGLEIPTAAAIGQMGADQSVTLRPNPQPRRRYPWGDKADPDRTNYMDSGLWGTSAVGCFSGGTSPYGCEEMSGNVYEWTRSLWGKNPLKSDFNYPYNPTDGREDLEASTNVRYVVRGGACYSNEFFVRCVFRNWNFQSDSTFDLGFRLVVSPILSS